ncbi:alpha/beta hydrolase fold domain-containing protein [Kineococcus sp. LSe6-4]|uniref:Alpha/beta hydrolase fold domain-containing protein n=1 Tax=Kineococcus halophytocola TaxID=3234027 RepID=A0ABV4GZV9_9ACTN
MRTHDDDADGVPVRVYRPDTGLHHEPRAGLVWAHGGGFVAGDLDMPESDAVARRLQDDGVLVVAVDYRRAGPGTTYPAPSDDVLTAWRWGREFCRSEGVAAERVQLGGASAGGNLAAGAVLRLLAGEGEVPAAVFLAYPTLHAVPPAASPVAQAAVETLPPDQRWSAADVAAMYEGFLGGPVQTAPAPAVPGTADLAGFPPTLVLTSEADGLRGSAEEFVRRLVLAGSPVVSVCEPGTVHGHLNTPDARFDASLRRVVRWLVSAQELTA